MRFTVLLALLGLVLSSPVVPAQPLSALRPTFGFASGGVIGETAIFNVGGSQLRTAPFVVALGFGLGPSCMPTCLSPPLYVVKLGMLDSRGSGTARLSVPNAPALIGQTVFVEATIALSAPYFERPPLLAWIIPAPNAPRFQPVPVAALTDLRTNREFVLIAGGFPPTDRAMLYDTQARTFSTLTRMTATRGRVSVVSSPLGGVLLFGGEDSRQNVLDTVEVFEIYSRRFQPWGRMTGPRAWHDAVMLDGRFVLVVGGQTRQGARDDVEIFDSVAGVAARWPSRLLQPRTGCTVVPRPSGGFAVFGGPTSVADATRSPELLTLGGSVPFRPIAESRGSPDLIVSTRGSVFAFFGGNTQFLK